MSASSFIFKIFSFLIYKQQKGGKNEFQKKNSKSNQLLVNIQVLLFFFFENDLFVLLLNQHLSSILPQRSLNGAHCMSISIIFNNAAKKSKKKQTNYEKILVVVFFLNGDLICWSTFLFLFSCFWLFVRWFGFRGG
jgi:hypothetical protein